MTQQENRPLNLRPYRGPAGGQGSIKSVVEILTREKTLVESGALLLKQNKTNGFMCVSCAWPSPASRTRPNSARTAQRRPPGS